MKIRVLTALVLILLVVYLIVWAPRWAFLLALIVVVERGLYEYFLICRRAGWHSFPAVGYAAGGLVCLSQIDEVGSQGGTVVAVLLLTLLLVMCIGLFAVQDLKHYLEATASTVSGVIYVALSLSFLVSLRFGPRPASTLGLGGNAGMLLTLLLFGVVWADDIFAYLFGRFLGHTPLFPRVSPNKTVEGAMAGLAGSLAAAWACIHWLWQTRSVKTGMLLGGLVAVGGQLGDLAESALKRGAELKDSGSILPGHGGLLDRIDSLIFGAPVLWLALAVRELFK